MKNSLFIILLTLIFFPKENLGSCYGEQYSITEVLNHDLQNPEIFTCTILKTYKINAQSYVNIAVVNEVYAGSPKDTVYINSGYLGISTERLIFSPSSDSLHFSSGTCDNLSKILNPKNTYHSKNYLSGDDFINILEQYREIKKSNFSGEREIKSRDILAAEGEFKNGRAHGKWIHYENNSQTSENIIKSIINYKEGKIDGEYIKYYSHRDTSIIRQKTLYDSDLILRKESSQAITSYEYLNDFERKMKIERFNEAGELTTIINYHQHNFNNHSRVAEIHYLDGYYWSIDHHPMAEGFYHKGQRISNWTFYNLNGDVDSSIIYPYQSELNDTLKIHNLTTNKVYLIGRVKNNKRIGNWKSVKDDELTGETFYSSEGEILKRIEYYSSGGKVVTPFINGKIHGKKISYHANGSVKSTESYKNSRINGRSTYYDLDGNILIEFDYINSRKNGGNKNATYVDGVLHGPYRMYSQDGSYIVEEGEYWNGYKLGLWINRNENGSHQKSYYRTDGNEIMHEGYLNRPLRYEKYDENHVLIDEWNSARE